MTNFESFPWNISSSINLLVLKSTCVHCTYLNYEIIFSAHLSVLECTYIISWFDSIKIVFLQFFITGARWLMRFSRPGEKLRINRGLSPVLF